ncbi:MAG: hypothetical protein P1P78_11265 [Methyloprofundus sp.]|nr:hypothetical protein [Methyloprofundus sp.]
MELLVGLSGVILLLLGALIISIRRTAKERAQKERAEAALDTIRKAGAAINAVITEQEADDENQQQRIAARHYFGG